MEHKNEPVEPVEYLFKILVVGDAGTGKTSIIKRYVHNVFNEHYKSTVGVDFALKVLELDNNTVVRLQLWDIAGQDRFVNLARVYFKEAFGAFVVFDITKLSTLESALKWKKEIDEKMVGIPPTINVALLANKCDLPEEEHIINVEALDELCEKHGFDGWEKVSAKTNINIDHSMLFLVNQIVKRINHFDNPDVDNVIMKCDMSVSNDKNSCC